MRAPDAGRGTSLEATQLGRLPKHASQRVGDLAKRTESLNTFEDARHSVVPSPRRSLEVVQELLDASRIAMVANGAQAIDLSLAYGWVDAKYLGVDLGHCRVEAVHANDNPLARLDLTLETVSGLLDLVLDVTLLDSGDRAAEIVHLLNHAPGFVFNPICEP